MAKTDFFSQYISTQFYKRSVIFVLFPLILVFVIFGPFLFHSIHLPSVTILILPANIWLL